MDLNLQKKLKEEKEKKRCLSLLSSDMCRLAIDWLKAKITEHGGKITDEEKFEASLQKYIERSWVTTSGKALLSSASTLFDVTPQKGKSLRKIFSDNRIDIGEYMFSITITSTEVLVVDGFGNGRRRVEFDYINNSFIYGTPTIQARKSEF